MLSRFHAPRAIGFSRNCQPTKGRIYAIRDTKAHANPRVKETADLLKTGLEKAGPDTLVKLLDHPDRRVRT